MTQTIPPTITAAPTAPQRGDSATFSARVDAFLTWLIAAVGQFGDVAANVYSNALDGYNSAVAAANSAAAAAASSNATKWISGTNYNEGVVVWSPTDFLNYRRKATGGGTVDPALDAANWACLDILIDTAVTSNAIGLGAKTFSASTGKRFQPGMYLVIADALAPSTNSMFGQITSYNSATGVLVMSITSVKGSGTHSSWLISQSSAGGAAAGANSDITSLAGLTTPLSVSQGGSGSNAAPKCSAYQSVQQTISPGTITKVSLQSEDFDTDNCFDSVSFYRFQPNVARYYFVGGVVEFTNSVDTAIAKCWIFKNGSAAKSGGVFHMGANSKHSGPSVNTLIYLNGTTDYVELYVYQDTGVGQAIQNDSVSTYFYAFPAW